MLQRCERAQAACSAGYPALHLDAATAAGHTFQPRCLCRAPFVNVLWQQLGDGGRVPVPAPVNKAVPLRLP